jgi:dolichol kinase
MTLVLTVVGVLAVLLIAEHLARHTNLHAELTRKFVHMIVGTFVAFWPFFLSWHQIELLSMAFLAVILVSVKFTVFKSIHTVPRRAFGEISFAMVIGFLAVISSSAEIFMAAMLCLSLGDALAAIIGLLYGDGNQYKVFGKTKSVAGTATFFVTTVLVMILYVTLGNASASIMTLFVIPVLATITENVAVNGSDNLVMPLLIALLLGGTA